MALQRFILRSTTIGSDLLSEILRNHLMEPASEKDLRSLTVFHMGRAESALLQIVSFITSVRDSTEPRNLVTFPKI